MPGPKTVPIRYQDRLGKPFKLAENEEIRPLRRVYTLADEPIFDAVLLALVANATARLHVSESYRIARADRSLTPDKAADLLATAVATMRALPLSEARRIVDARASRALAPGTSVLAPKGRAGGRATETAARKAAVRRGHRHRT